MKGKISAKGIRVKVLQKLIELHNTLYQRYEAFDWNEWKKQHMKDSHIRPDFVNYLWTIVKEEDVMEILGCSRRTAHDYLAVLKNFVN